MRTRTGAEKRAAWGYAYLHCVIDDHSRYAYVEQHRDQGGETAAAVLDRAICHFASLGMKGPEAVMSDNAFAYRKSAAFRDLLARPRRPPHPHPALHAALEREGGEIHSDPEEGVGICPLLAKLSRADQGPGILPSLLQPAQAPQSLSETGRR